MLEGSTALCREVLDSALLDGIVVALAGVVGMSTRRSSEFGSLVLSVMYALPESPHGKLHACMTDSMVRC